MSGPRVILQKLCNPKDRNYIKAPLLQRKMKSTASLKSNFRPDAVCLTASGHRGTRLPTLLPATCEGPLWSLGRLHPGWPGQTPSLSPKVCMKRIRVVSSRFHFMFYAQYETGFATERLEVGSSACHVCTLRPLLMGQMDHIFLPQEPPLTSLSAPFALLRRSPPIRPLAPSLPWAGQGGRLTLRTSQPL